MKRIILLSTILLSCLELFSMKTPYRSYTVTDGLSNSSVKAIYQDNMGYIWLGTRDGLNRLDGYEVKNFFYKSDTNVKQSNDIVSITSDRQGRMWIGTFNGVTVFDPFSEKYLDISIMYQGEELPKGVVVGVWIAPDEAVWVATKIGVYVMHDRRCTRLDEFRGLDINSMAPGGNNQLLLSVSGRGIARLDTETMKAFYDINGDNYQAFLKILQDSKGRTWLASGLDNVLLYQPQNHSVTKIKTLLPVDATSWKGQIHDMLVYNDSILLFATDNGLWAMNERTHAIRRQLGEWQPSGLFGSCRLMSLYEDRQGGLWAGTFNEGVLFYHPRQYLFRYHPLTTDPFHSVRVNGQLIEGEGKLWIGHNEGICTLDLKDGHVNEIRLSDEQSQMATKNEVYHMFPYEADQILFYILNKGIYSLNMKTSTVCREITVLSSERQVRSMAKDSVGNIWIAEDELTCYDPHTKILNRSFTTNQDGSTRFMLTQDLLAYGTSMLVGGRTSGVWHFNYSPNEQAPYFKGDHTGFEEVENKNVSVLYQDKNKNVWVGTFDSGVYCYEPQKKTIEHFGVEQGLIHNSVCGVVEDRKTGDIWISTIIGLSRLSFNDLKIVNYTCDTAFPLNEVSRKALLQTKEGRIYVGGNNGIAEFDPQELVKWEEGEKPIVYLSSINSLASDNQTEQVKYDNARSLEHVELSYKNAAVVIKFSSLDYIFPKAYRYAYRMDGLDNNWNYSDRNEVVYSHLSAGHYTFYVKACNSDGIWGQETTVNVIVHPPVWLTLWAKVIYVLLSLMIIALALYYWYKRKTDKYKRKIEEIKKENVERNYRMKMELFTNFSHELRTPLTLITGPVEDILQDDTLPERFLYPMKQIYKNSNRLLLLVNQLMDFRKLEYGAMQLRLSRVNLGVFLTGQIDSFSDLLKKKELTIGYTNNYYGEELWIDIDLMEKVLFNLLSNAVKHSPKGTRILVRSVARESSVVISVKDCGEGISKENISKIFDLFFQVEQGGKSNLFGSGIGLNMAQYAVKLHKGKIWVESTLGCGAEFFVELNLGKECFAEANVEFVENDEDTYLKKIKRECITPIEEKNVKQKEGEKRPHILLVEDDDDMRQYTSLLLSKQYVVNTASNGKKALEIAVEQVPDLIVSDVMMPVMNGVELCKAVKDEKITAHIPVVLLTAKVLSEHIEEGYEALADDYVLKPFIPKVLLAKLDSILKNRNRLRLIFREKLDSIEVPVAELSAQDSFIQEVMDLIREKAHEPELSVNDLYETLNMGRSQFFRKVRAISNVSPNKLIQNVRMKLAVEMLATGQYSISEVAYSVGYSDPSYFGKVFKATYGIAPTSYLKQHDKSVIS